MCGETLENEREGRARRERIFSVTLTVAHAASGVDAQFARPRSGLQFAFQPRSRTYPEYLSHLLSAAHACLSIHPPKRDRNPSLFEIFISSPASSQPSAHHDDSPRNGLDCLDPVPAR